MRRRPLLVLACLVATLHAQADVASEYEAFPLHMSQRLWAPQLMPLFAAKQIDAGEECRRTAWQACAARATPLLQALWRWGPL